MGLDSGHSNDRRVRFHITDTTRMRKLGLATSETRLVGRAACGRLPRFRRHARRHRKRWRGPQGPIDGDVLASSEVGQAGGSAVDSVPAVGGLAPARWPVAAGEHAAVIAGGERAVLGEPGQPGGAAEVEYLSGRSRTTRAISVSQASRRSVGASTVPPSRARPVDVDQPQQLNRGALLHLGVGPASGRRRPLVVTGIPASQAKDHRAVPNRQASAILLLRERQASSATTSRP